MKYISVIKGENMFKSNDLRLAVLIDAENVPYKNIKGMLEEISKYGMPTIKRIYGDWTKSNISGWKNILLENAITPIQQYSYTTGKNSSDSAMIIDAMDILYSKQVDGFCIISSDSDFTRLVTRLRESGKKVIGIGERKTPTPFIVACDKFIYIEILNEVNDEDKAISNNENSQKKQSKTIARIDPEIINLLYVTVNDVADEDGWAFLADVGNLMQKKRPDFDTRNYGFSKLTQLIKTLNQFEIDERDSGRSNIKHIFIRNLL
jgi:uncharacterized protein (TIGR00288 family)